MDIPRYALIAASVLLGLMLLGEWTRFNTAQQEASLPTVPMVDAGRAAPDTADEMTVFNNTSQNDMDLPSVDDINLTNSQALFGDSPADAATGSIVTVHTDTLEIKIDLEGGDVVGAALKNYPKTLDDPTDPFVLLERNAVRTYVAQSGLVGPDGIDQNQRARYRASQDVYTLSGREALEVVIDYADTDSALRVSKHFTFEPGSHTIGVHYTITNRGAETAQLTPFAQLKRDSSPAPVTSDAGMGMQPFLGSALTQPDQRFSKFDFEDMAKDPSVLTSLAVGLRCCNIILSARGYPMRITPTASGRAKPDPATTLLVTPARLWWSHRETRQPLVINCTSVPRISPCWPT